MVTIDRHSSANAIHPGIYRPEDIGIQHSATRSTVKSSATRSTVNSANSMDRMSCTPPTTSSPIMFPPYSHNAYFPYSVYPAGSFGLYYQKAPDAEAAAAAMLAMGHDANAYEQKHVPPRNVMHAPPGMAYDPYAPGHYSGFNAPVYSYSGYGSYGHPGYSSIPAPLLPIPPMMQPPLPAQMPLGFMPAPPAPQQAPPPMTTSLQGSPVTTPTQLSPAQQTTTLSYAPILPAPPKRARVSEKVRLIRTSASQATAAAAAASLASSSATIGTAATGTAAAASSTSPAATSDATSPVVPRSLSLPSALSSSGVPPVIMPLSSDKLLTPVQSPMEIQSPPAQSLSLVSFGDKKRKRPETIEGEPQRWQRLSQNHLYRQNLLDNGIRPIRTGQHSFSCSKCSEVFDKEMFVWRHGVKHLERKPFLCTTCYATFNRSDSLQRHVRNFHRTD